MCKATSIKVSEVSDNHSGTGGESNLKKGHFHMGHRAYPSLWWLQVNSYCHRNSTKILVHVLQCLKHYHWKFQSFIAIFVAAGCGRVLKSEVFNSGFGHHIVYYSYVKSTLPHWAWKRSKMLNEVNQKKSENLKKKFLHTFLTY